MKILWVATKPPWPLADGGRLVQWHTIAALAGAGAEITLVAPADPGLERESMVASLRSICHAILIPHAPRSWMRALPDAILHRVPLAIARHRIEAVGREVAQLLAQEHFDVVHAEQLQAVANCAAARAAGVPLVMRAQNVESDLWFALARHRGIGGGLVEHQAQRLQAWEADAVRRCDATIALTQTDAAKLGAIANTPEKAHCIRAPFPPELAGTHAPALAGNPALVIFGSSGWAPNRDGVDWFIREIWPSIWMRLPDATLHLFGEGGSSARTGKLTIHPAPDDSAAAFALGSILMVPLRIASGVRMKILEAWARGIPVVATREAAEGLGATAGRELMIACTSDEFASVIASLSDLRIREAMISDARALLRINHDPTMIAEKMLALCRGVVTSSPAHRSRG